MQIRDQFAAFGSSMGLRVTVVIGGEDMVEQARALQTQPHVVVATPGRLADLCTRGATPPNFRGLRTVVLDEADRLLERSFAPDMQVIMQRLPQHRQTLLYSATITAGVESITTLALKSPLHFKSTSTGDSDATTVAKLEQRYLFVPGQAKMAYLCHVLREYGPALGMSRGESTEGRVDSVIVFTATTRGCATVSEVLREMEVLNTPLHSLMPQKERINSLAKFKSGVVKVLVATDVASRGLDIPRVALVLNFDVPRVVSDYIHRVGRTARAGRGGKAVTIVTPHDVSLVHRIEEKIGKKMEVWDEVDEEDVVRIVGKVSSSRKVAALRLADDGFEEKWAQAKARKAASRARQAAVLGETGPGAAAAVGTKRKRGDKSSARKGGGHQGKG
jgi:ATP-dependent RNA helicase DDX49/DBP8